MGLGYPCFRPDAVPIILLTTDESPTNGSNTLKCPAESAVVNAATSINARIVGIMYFLVPPEIEDIMIPR